MAIDVKKTRIRLKKNRIYVDRDLRPDETEADGYRKGRPPADVHDTALESHDHRRHFQENEGDISIIVEAGDELGDIGVCVQYEGQIVGDNKGLANRCVAKQSAVIQDAAGWLKEILSQFETDWEADVLSAPCPLADEKLNVRAAVARLTGVEIEEKIVNQVGPRIQVNPTVEVK